ncbi:MAG: menaquinone biosynthesis decarboxylase [Desulfobacterales bacterium]|nr:menaquinone biosynthesis decarboxylase [Desulfobacterales bacterium]
MRRPTAVYKNLGEFVAALERAGELKRIPQTVSAHLEISRLTDIESKSPQGGKALYFESVAGSPFPAATNLFGSPRRIGMALGVTHLDQLAERVRDVMEIDPPGSLRDMLGLLPTALSVTRFFPRRFRGKTPPCQEVVLKGADIDLGQLPVLHCWPKDAGPFVTLPLVFTRSLKTGVRNCGMYRLQVFDRNTTGMHWHIHKDGSNYYNEYRRAGRRMPVAVAIGADPATIYAATAPLPRNLDEMMLAGFIRNRPVTMARCLTVDMEVPAEAEFVLEGYVDPDERRIEGPFGDHTGYYSLADEYPVFHVTAITHRRRPLYCATLVGRPPMEDCYLAKATERLFLPLLQTAFPEIEDYWLPWEGVFHNIVIVAIDKAYPMHAQQIMSGLWGQGQMSFCKIIVVVDRDVNPQDPAQVIVKLLTQLDVSADLTHTKGVLDVLDHSSPTPIHGSKLGVDLTARVAGEPPRRKSASLAGSGMSSPANLAKDVAAQVPGIVGLRIFPDDPAAIPDGAPLLMVKVIKPGDRAGRDYARRLLDIEALKVFRLMLLYDADIDLDDNSLILWKLFNNTDPGRDIHFDHDRCVVDACRKDASDGHLREWPEELTFDV